MSEKEHAPSELQCAATSVKTKYTRILRHDTLLPACEAAPDTVRKAPEGLSALVNRAGNPPKVKLSCYS